MLQGFSKLNYKERIDFLKKNKNLTQGFDKSLIDGGLDIQKAQCLVENVVGLYHLPFSIVPSFEMNSKTFTIPMVIEETSIIAALGKTLSWIKNSEGEITAEKKGFLNLGQVQIPVIKDVGMLQEGLKNYKQSWIRQINETVGASLVTRGGGVENLCLRVLDRPDGRQMGVIGVEVNTCEAMGANKINQICEYLKPLVEDYLGESVGLCIVSNFK